MSGDDRESMWAFRPPSGEPAAAGSQRRKSASPPLTRDMPRAIPGAPGDVWREVRQAVLDKASEIRDDPNQIDAAFALIWERESSRELIGTAGEYSRAVIDVLAARGLGEAEAFERLMGDLVSFEPEETLLAFGPDPSITLELLRSGGHIAAWVIVKGKTWVFVKPVEEYSRMEVAP
jgi:hypothetical protein